MKKTKIVAAGGLVSNEKGELLLIFRKKKWDLPKGKFEANESIEQCAIREVQEETGLKEINLLNLVGKTYHEYYEKWIRKHVIKETWWYAMEVKGNPDFTPQAEEAIEEVIWADETTLKKCLKNTFPNIISIIDEWKNKIAKH
ncbi:MAG: NUDIX domain-containing protein [Chitinophagaceae bacterium]|nr:NUDIX domain-containing protein [Chitinophagaceae bacterium]MCZ2298419.1 NUDIX domain-containing protein [Chitinophagales bacterium]